MAATRLIAMHMNKGKSLSKCLKDRTDYEINPDKTEGGKYVSSYACDSKTVVEEFVLSKREYEQKTGKQPKGDVIAYQIRQSFKPGEVTPELANRIGYETAMRFTKGNHAFVVSTHTDRAHIHNHVIFNSTALSGDRKFKDFFLSGIALGRISNLICLENGLSVIAPQPFHNKSTYIRPDRGSSFREGLRSAIDIALSKKPQDFNALLAELAAQGYEIKRGKHTAVRGPGQQRFIRFRSLGVGYTEADIQKKIEGVVRGAEQNQQKTPAYREKDFDLLLNL